MHRVLKLFLFAVPIVAFIGLGEFANGQNLVLSLTKTISATPTAKESTPVPLAEIVLQYSAIDLSVSTAALDGRVGRRLAGGNDDRSP